MAYACIEHVVYHGRLGFWFQGLQFGEVIFHPEDPHFVGAERHSNNTGQLTAMLEALHYAEGQAETLGIPPECDN